MRDGERRDDDDERTETAERNHQAQQEQQAIDAAKDVEKTIHDEPRHGLEPSRVEPDVAGVAVELKCAFRAAAWLKTQNRYRSQTGRFKAGEMDRRDFGCTAA